MSLVDLALGVLCLELGLLTRLSLLRLFVYTFPYVGGNLLYNTLVPVKIGRVAGFAIIALAFSGLVRSGGGMSVIKEKAGRLLLVTTMITLAGLFWALWSSDSLPLWNQEPLERASRSTVRQITFWLIPIGFSILIRNAEECRTLMRDGLIAGGIYSALGLLQFGVGITTGTDIFPITRVAGDYLTFQSMIGLDGHGRVTSICGEPRYFSSFLTMWLVFAVMCGPKAGLRSWQVSALSLLFLAVNALTASRSGLAQLLLILLSILVLSFVRRNRGMLREAVQISVFVLVTVTGVLCFGDLTVKGRIAFVDEAPGNRFTVAGYSFPMEYQDGQVLRLMVTNPAFLVAGFGAGLWQYATNPYDNLGYRQTYFSAGVLAIDSMRPNISGLGLLTDFGLFGVWLTVRVYKQCVRVAGSAGSEALRRQFMPAVTVLLIATFAAATTDTYCNVMLFVVLALWRYTADARGVPAMQVLAPGRDSPEHRLGP